MASTPQGTDTCLRVNQADGSGAIAEMVPRAQLIDVVTVVRLMDDYFASKLKEVLDKIQPSLKFVKI